MISARLPIIIFTVVLAMPHHPGAAAAKQKSFYYKDEYGNRIYAVEVPEIEMLKPFATGRPVDYEEAKRVQATYAPYVNAAAAANGLDANLVNAVIWSESGWDANAKSRKGACGLMQLMPGTARDLGVSERDPVQNIHGGTRYLRSLYDTFKDMRLALAAYNAGPDAVRRHNGIPPYRETIDYVNRVTKWYGMLKQRG